MICSKSGWRLTKSHLKPRLRNFIEGASFIRIIEKLISIIQETNKPIKWESINLLSIPNKSLPKDFLIWNIQKLILWPKLSMTQSTKQWLWIGLRGVQLAQWKTKVHVDQPFFIPLLAGFKDWAKYLLAHCKSLVSSSWLIAYLVVLVLKPQSATITTKLMVSFD